MRRNSRTSPEEGIHGFDVTERLIPAVSSSAARWFSGEREELFPAGALPLFPAARLLPSRSSQSFLYSPLKDLLLLLHAITAVPGVMQIQGGQSCRTTF